MATTTSKATATIQVPSFKLTIPLNASALPPDLVPPEGPAGEPVLDLVLERGAMTVRAKLNGRNVRKLLKQIAENGADRMSIALQGVLRPPATQGGPYILESAGFQAVVRPPAEPALGTPPPA